MCGWSRSACSICAVVRFMGLRSSSAAPDTSPLLLSELDEETVRLSSPSFQAYRPGRIVICLLCSFIVLLCGCDYIRSALPPSPSPFPVLARLPTVTPMTPSPTPQPTRTPRPSPTRRPPPALQGTVAVGANVRVGPGTDFAIVTSIVAGNTVTILGQNSGWYQVQTPDGSKGWMSALVLEVTPAVATAVPAVVP